MAIYAHVYIYTRVLLRIHMRRVCGASGEVDPIEELIWSKACIAKAIARAIAITTQKLSPPFSRAIPIAVAT